MSRRASASRDGPMPNRERACAVLSSGLRCRARRTMRRRPCLAACPTATDTSIAVGARPAPSSERCPIPGRSLGVAEMDHKSAGAQFRSRFRGQKIQVAVWLTGVRTSTEAMEQSIFNGQREPAASIRHREQRHADQTTPARLPQCGTAAVSQCNGKCFPTKQWTVQAQ